MITKLATALTLAFGAFFAVAPAPSRAQQPLANVPVVASDTIRDVAVTVVERGQATIYYNPGFLAHVGPRLGHFFLAHEYGHIASGHTGGALSAGDPRFAPMRRVQELEADCYAAERLGREDLASALAVVQFFARMGSFRFDGLHPTGVERATMIAACLPGPHTDSAVVAALRTRVEPVTFTLRAPRLADQGCEAQLWLDGVPVGVLSNLRLVTSSLIVRGFAPGAHEYAITARLYALDRTMQLTSAGAVSGEGTITVAQGDLFRLS
jgi:hypothetical protein